MSNHNIHFDGEVRKKYQYVLVEKGSLSGAMDNSNAMPQ